MPLSSDETFLDTNVVIECHRTGSWKALAGNYTLSTVDKVIEECGTGPHNTVDVQNLRKQVRAYSVLPQELVGLKLALAGQVNLDPGEEHLLAKAQNMPGTWKICSPDNALVRACWLLQRLGRVVSLESLLDAIGHQPKLPLKTQYTERWLSGKRIALQLETL